ncbi:MAG: YraN family protein, partial [Patescibacteria group bacterium]
ISFVEVKTLTSDKNFFPEAKVDFVKQRKIVRSAQSWLMRNKIPLDSPWQVDVVAITIDTQTNKADIRHLENAVF